MKRLFAFLFFLSSFLFISNLAQAAEFRVASKDSENITVAADEKMTNLYAAGNVLNIDADVAKSLYLGGNTITINGDVENDLKVGGNTILVRGNIGGSAHLAGSSVIIDGPVADDLFIGAGTVTIADTAKIGGDLYVGGGVVNLQAPVAGKVMIGGGQITINSAIAGDVKVESDELTLGDKATLQGNLKYRSPKELTMAENATVAGSIDYEHMDGNVLPSDGSKVESKEMSKIFGAFATGAWALKLVCALISSFIVFFLFGKMLKVMQKEVFAKFWSRAGLGFVLMIVVPVATIFLLISLIGIWLAGLNIMVFVLLSMLAKAMANIFFGLWIIKLFAKKNVELTWKPVLVGALLLPTICMIPMIGGLVGFVFWLVALASLYQLFYQKVLKK